MKLIVYIAKIFFLVKIAIWSLWIIFLWILEIVKELLLFLINNKLKILVFLLIIIIMLVVKIFTKFLLLEK